VSLASGIDGSAGRQHYERLFADMIRDPRLLGAHFDVPGAMVLSKSLARIAA